MLCIWASSLPHHVCAQWCVDILPLSEVSLHFLCVWCSVFSSPDMSLVTAMLAAAAAVSISLHAHLGYLRLSPHLRWCVFVHTVVFPDICPQLQFYIWVYVMNVYFFHAAASSSHPGLESFPTCACCNFMRNTVSSNIIIILGKKV